MLRQQIVDEARKWLGTKWVHQGRGKHGIDCIGLVQKVGLAFGIEHEDRTDYGREPNDLELMAHLRKYLDRVPVNVRREGMVGVFRQATRPCHVGIFSMKNGVEHLIHSRVSTKSVIEEPFRDGHAQLHLVEVLGFPGLEDI